VGAECHALQARPSSYNLFTSIINPALSGADCVVPGYACVSQIQLAEYSNILNFHGYNTHASTHGIAIIIFFANKD
jgi:heme/copper-type cytochrome/quinol oxidase subunit 1